MAEWLRNPEVKLQTGIHGVLLVTAAAAAAIIWDIGCALYAAAICLAGSGISLWFTAKRYDRLSQLSREVDRVLYGNDSMAGIPDEEGELAVLASKIYKMTIRQGPGRGAEDRQDISSGISGRYIASGKNTPDFHTHATAAA